MESSKVSAAIKFNCDAKNKMRIRDSLDFMALKIPFNHYIEVKCNFKNSDI